MEGTSSLQVGNPGVFSVCLPLGLRRSTRHENWCSAAREQLSRLLGAWIQLLQAPIDDWRALQDIMQNESAQVEERANGSEIRAVSVMAPHTEIKGDKCPTRRLSGDSSANSLPMQHVRVWFDLGANGLLYPRLALLLLRSSRNCLRPGLAISVVSTSVLHLQHTSDDADCIDRIKTLAEIINSHAKRVISRKATKRRTWAAAMERPFSPAAEHRPLLQQLGFEGARTPSP